MTEIFTENDDTLIEEDFEASDTEELESTEKNILEARRRLEKMLEEKRLREELEDFA